MLNSAFLNQRICRAVTDCINKTRPILISLPAAQAVFTYLIAKKVGGPFGIIIKDSHLELDVLSRDICALFGESISFFPPFFEDETSVPGFVSEQRRVFERSYSSVIDKTSKFGLVFEPVLSYAVGSKGSRLLIKNGAPSSRGGLIEALALWGYKNTDHCQTPKTYAVRGGIVDFFPTNTKRPVRVEFFSNHIESVCYFNEDTQRSTEIVERVSVLPPVEFLDKQPSFVNTFKTHYTTILYITPTGLSFLDREVGGHDELYVESFGVPVLEKGGFVDKVDGLIPLYESLYFFNPTRRVFSFSSSVNTEGVALSGGFKIESLGLACVRAPGRPPAAPPPKAFPGVVPVERLRGLSEIEWGDFLVHVDFGVGVYRGLSLVGKAGSEEENIKIEYRGGAVVHVPVNRFGRVHKYVGTGGGPPQISRLGSGQWEKQKQITKKSVAAVVDYLIKAYKSRSKPRGFSYSYDEELMGRLEQSFPHQETEDQLVAIEEINNDMDKNNPMDRLLYGDVGFGKTEVAIRAAMRSVISGRLVFFLAPTTVLSDQHYITCKNRLGDLGVSVELLSRFKTKKQQQKIIERLHRGNLDVLVGTHRLLGEDVPTKNLGLLIVDEEQRFGVKHKETIRLLKSRVDILTLTATPIPRTLQQSLIGVRDTSKIETPPRERLPIKTTVSFFDWGSIASSIRFEADRGGQVYFLHNDVVALPYYYDKIKILFPELRVSVAHGQMSSRELEKTILAFFDGTIDVLICTTIIESGLDVQNANTIIINNAQHFGLAQLYQIRGRVGRGNRQAYCFLSIPKNSHLPPDAYQRLRAIEHYSTLGSGYRVAMRDLELRGAGNIFGYEQSGEISRVGLELYNKILSAALDEGQNGGGHEKKELLSVVFAGDAYLGSDYMPLVQDRLAFYQKISSATSKKALFEIKEEVVDRFGGFSNKEENFFILSEVQCGLYPHPFTRCVIDSSSTVFTLSSLPSGLGGGLFFQNMERVFSSQPIPYKISTTPRGFLEISFSTKTLSGGLLFARKFHRLFSRVMSG